VSAQKAADCFSGAQSREKGQRALSVFGLWTNIWLVTFNQPAYQCGHLLNRPRPCNGKQRTSELFYSDIGQPVVYSMTWIRELLLLHTELA